MVQTVINKLKLDGTWIKVSVNDNSFYLIAIKEKAKKLKEKEKEIESNKVNKIYFEIGIDSGIKDKPIAINRISLDFNDETSDNEDINSITAFTRVQGLPKEFYIRPIKIIDYTSTVYSKDIETAIAIKVNLN